MAENPSEVIAGAAVLAAAVGFLVYAGQSTGFTGNAATYPLVASFRSVDGVTVGTVTALKLNPQTFFADATISLRDDVLLPDDSTILVSSEGLLGGSFIELQPGGSLENLGPGDEIEDTQGAVSVIALLMKFVGASASPTPAPAE